MDYALFCGSSWAILKRMISDWITRTVPKELLITFLMRRIVSTVESLSPGSVYRYFSSVILPLGTASNALLLLYSPSSSFTLVLASSATILVFRVLHALCFEGYSYIAREFRLPGAQSHLLTCGLPSLFHVFQYISDNDRYWFEAVVCNWRIVRWMIPGRSPDVTEPLLREVHNNFSVRSLFLVELVRETYQLTHFYIRSQLTASVHQINGWELIGCQLARMVESVVWLTCVFFGSKIVYRDTTITDSQQRYNRCQEISHVAFHMLYLLWLLILRFPCVHRVPFLSARVIPLALREEEEFMHYLYMFIDEPGVYRAIHVLKSALQDHQNVDDQQLLHVADVFELNNTLSLTKEKFRRTLELLERYVDRLAIVQRSIPLLTRSCKVSDAVAESLKSEGTQCTICLSEFKSGDVMRRLRCGHTFHEDEIRSWMKRNNMCPLCRRTIGLKVSKPLAIFCQLLLPLPSLLQSLRLRRGNLGTGLLRYL